MQHVCAHTHTDMHGHMQAYIHARARARTHAQACDVFYLYKDVHAQEWSGGGELCHAGWRART